MTANRVVRKRALDATKLSVSNRQEYLVAVKAANREFKRKHPILRMQYVLERDFGQLVRRGLVVVYREEELTYVTGSYCDHRDVWDRHIAFFNAVYRDEPALIKDDAWIPLDNLPRSCRDLAAKLVRKYVEKNMAVTSE